MSGHKIDGHKIDGQVTQLMYDVEDWKPNLSRCQHSQKNSAVISVTHVAWQKNAYQTELLFQVSQWLFFFIYVTSLMFITHLFWAVGFLWVETQSWNWNTFEFPKSKDSSLRYDCKKCSLTIFWYIDINAAISSPNNRIEKHLSLSLNIKKIQGLAWILQKKHENTYASLRLWNHCDQFFVISILILTFI